MHPSGRLPAKDDKTPRVKSESDPVKTKVTGALKA